MLQDIELTAVQKDFLNKLFLGQRVSFVRGVADYDGFLDTPQPEICFAGRSNVGKSSLINALTGRSGLARASNTPGRTQELNYFTLDGDLFMVDLPGYGFAEAPKAKVDAWNGLIRDYLRGRPQLRRIFILIDSRHGLKKIDQEIFTMLDKVGVTYQIVLTKSDKISDKALSDLVEKTSQEIKKFIAVHPRILVTSSEKKLGLDGVRHEIACFMNDYKQLSDCE